MNTRGIKLIVTYLVDHEFEVGTDQLGTEIFYEHVAGLFGEFNDGSGHTFINSDCEVIGNIHENPELLKTSD
jgi:hypothetical protein